MTPTAEAVLDGADARLPAGVRLEDGEVVILAVRQHWSAPVLSGVVPTVALALVLGVLTARRSAPMPANILGVMSALTLLPLLVSLLRHATRRYILTDRRVILGEGRRFRQISLGSVREVLVHVPGGTNGPGDVGFRSEEGVMVWSRCARARETAMIAEEAVARYGGR